MVKTVAGIVLVFVVATVGWMVLGASVSMRSTASDASLRAQVGQLWGTPLTQQAPTASFTLTKHVTSVETTPRGTVAHSEEVQESLPVPLVASEVTLDLHLDQRRKGLLWYSTYRVRFAGEYTFEPSHEGPEPLELHFAFPADNGIYDEFTLTVDDRKVPFERQGSACVTAKVAGEGSRRHVLRVGYVSQGLDRFVYTFGEGIKEVREFRLTATTDFGGFDFPANTMSPTSKSAHGSGAALAWQYKDLITGNGIGIETPKKLNPGPLAARISFFAPVSLGFFFFLVFVIATLKGVEIHPVSYFFLGCSFFAFHLLLAYLADHLSIHLAFAICSLVSLFLVVSYMRLVVGARFAFVEVAVAQLLYLVGFSYAFFFEGFTGLAVTIGAIATLFVVMQLTARVSWKGAGSGAR
jgi:hypothetical protein